MLYYEILDGGAIGAYTNNSKVAEKFGWTGITSENIISYNGKNYLESNKPEPTAEEIKANKKLEIDAKYKNLFDTLKDALVSAEISNNSTSVESIKSNYNEAMQNYAAELEALK